MPAPLLPSLLAHEVPVPCTHLPPPPLPPPSHRAPVHTLCSNPLAFVSQLPPGHIFPSGHTFPFELGCWPFDGEVTSYLQGAELKRERRMIPWVEEDAAREFIAGGAGIAVAIPGGGGGWGRSSAAVAAAAAAAYIVCPAAPTPVGTDA